MNPQNIIISAELISKAINFLRLIHNSAHPKSIHDEVTNIINAIQQTAKPLLPEPNSTIKEVNENL